MDRHHLSTLVHNLSDLSLALLLCLVASKHCILTSPTLDDLCTSLTAIASTSFSLTTAVIECATPSTSTTPREVLDTFIKAAIPPRGGTTLANVLILRNLDVAPEHIQVQVLELMRTRHITARAEVLVPARFLVLAVVHPGYKAGMMRYLRSEFFISHNHHDAAAAAAADASETSSLSSVVVVRRQQQPHELPEIPDAAVAALQEYAGAVEVASELRRYMHDIAVFLRLHRAVRSGSVKAKTAADFELLVKCLAPLHNYTYATPPLVRLAAFKVYSHHIELAGVDEERSMQWGSARGAVEEMLRGYDEEVVVDEVLCEVREPV